MKKRILFFNEDIEYDLRHKQKIRTWLQDTAKQEQKEIDRLNYVFCNDKYLLKLNRQYLNHQTLTDILTFDQNEGLNLQANELAADIYISIDRIRENARLFNVSIRDELHRVMVHGLLHLAGYRDDTPSHRKQMRAREDYYLSLRSF